METEVTQKDHPVIAQGQFLLSLSLGWFKPWVLGNTFVSKLGWRIGRLVHFGIHSPHLLSLLFEIQAGDCRGEGLEEAVGQLVHSRTACPVSHKVRLPRKGPVAPEGPGTN